MGTAQEKVSIGAKELTATTTVLVASHAFLDYPRIVSMSGLEAAWMEPLVSGAVALVVVLIADALFRRWFPDLGLAEIARVLFGRVGAAVSSVLFAGFVLFMTATIMRQFIENVIVTVLPSTPILLIGTLFVLTSAYVAHCGLEAIARIGYLALPLLIAGVLALCFLTANWWNPSLLFPIWGSGVSTVLVGALKNSSVFTNVLVLILIRHHFHDAKDFRTVGIKSTLWSAVILAAFLAVYHMVFTPADTIKYSSPMYALARVIQLGRFVQRLESIFIFMWVSAAVVKIAVLLWVTAYFLAIGFEWPTYRPILPALATLALAGALLPPDVVSVSRIEEVYLMPYGWTFTFALPLAILAFAVWRRRKGRTRWS